MDKKQLRSVIRNLKAQASQQYMQVQSHRVFEIIEASVPFQSSRNILLYHSLPDELPTHDVIDRWKEMKNIYLPRVNGDVLDIVPLGKELRNDNRFNISEPTGATVNPDIIDLIIVPAVALDMQGHRLGRGKGYYDRLLDTTGAYTIGVALDFQLVENVPVEEHDKRLNAVVTASKHQFDIITV
ncbi:5-formyltetrahydrofolate cyclo-ligase [Sodaliphilus sp.]|uniref:5-formyltetrahydrofolate cyclo-ligase n=1 Tax=Sodaliphilus sp. TaxID=2815818 RepID=UPI00388DB93B